MVRQHVIAVLSQWYSGSSILNLLLDQQKDVRGIGESYAVYCEEKKGFCSCAHSLIHCPFFGTIDTTGFYRQCFLHYGCRVLVDTSKTCSNFALVYDPAIEMTVVVLSKQPHAWLYSRIGHHSEAVDDPLLAFQEYASFYRYNLRECRAQSIPLHILTYENLITDPIESLHALLDPFGIPVNADSIHGPWRTDTHIAGGNCAVYHQLQPGTAFFDAATKYQAKKDTLFLDEAWKEDSAFRMRCADAYRILAPDLDLLLAELGQPTATELARAVDPVSSFARLVLT